jgi:hypothetical protein
MAPLETSDWTYSDADLDALRRSVRLTMAENQLRREQIEEMLAERPWVEVAEFCSYHLQMRALNLGPWQDPPANGPDDGEAGALLDRMLDASISQWEPDPVAALAKVETKAEEAEQV